MTDKPIIAKTPLIINCYGGPNAGKSTFSAGLFHKLKTLGVNCELVTEVAKDFTWEENWCALNNQFYTTANQLYRQDRLEGKVDIIITDSPILIGLFYYKPIAQAIDDAFKTLVLETYKRKNNLNILIERMHGKYQQAGRTQTLEQSKQIDNNIQTFLDKEQLPYITATKNRESIDAVIIEIEKHLGYKIKEPLVK